MEIIQGMVVKYDLEDQPTILIKEGQNPLHFEKKINRNQPL